MFGIETGGEDGRRDLATKHAPSINVLLRLKLVLAVLFRRKNTLHGPQVNEDIDKRVQIGDGLPVTKLRPFDAQGNGLTENTLYGCALVVDLSIGITITVELVTNARTGSGGHDGFASAMRPFRVTDGAGTSRRFRAEQGTGITSALVLDQRGTIDESTFEIHG